MTYATCLACCPKVRTPLNSPAVGAKFMACSGMASTSGTISRSMPLTEPSMILATVGAGLSAAKTKGQHARAIAKLRSFRVMHLSLRRGRPPRSLTKIFVDSDEDLRHTEAHEIQAAQPNIRRVGN